MMNEIKNGYVKWSTFIWAISILVIAFGWCMAAQGQLAAKVESYNTQLLEIRTQLSQIQTDISWVKIQLQK